MPAPSQVPQTDAAATPGARAVPVPLIYKGLIACLLLVLYGSLTAAYVLGQRQVLIKQRAQIDELHEIEEAFKHAGLAVSNALLALQRVTADDGVPVAAGDSVPYALEAAERSLGGWRSRYATVFAQHRLAAARAADLSRQPTRANLFELRESLRVLANEIQQEGTRAGERHRSIAATQLEHGDRVTLAALGLGIGGLLAFGGIAAVFFARLASDLRSLGERAQEVVGGFRGEPLEVARRDEVGALTRAVNRMASDLDARERELELGREVRAHREKMAALGAMSRSLAHEIGNPLATISAVMQNAQSDPAGACGACQPDLILAQTQRIAQITRQIADFAGPQTSSPEPMDVGATLRAVCEFMQYDPRFRATRIEARAAGDALLAYAVPDELREVLMNLLQMAVEGPQPPARITVEAAPRGDQVVLCMRGGGTLADTPRLARTRRLVAGMRGQMTASNEGCELALPALDAAKRRI